MKNSSRSAGEPASPGQIRCSIRGGTPAAGAPELQGHQLNIIINEELRAFIDPLSANESAALERSLLAEGCRDALVLWGEVLIDGHNRHALCSRHGIPFRTVQNASFSSLDDVMLWMIDNHLARRSVSDFQRGVMALRKKEIVTARAASVPGSIPNSVPNSAPGSLLGSVPDAGPDAAPDSPPWNTREDVAKAARVSSNTIGQIERIQKAATPQLVEAVRSGTISISAAASVASLPQSAQIAAVAGGRKELQLAARQVREQKAGSRAPKEAPSDEASALRAQVTVLRQKIDALERENAELRGLLASAP